MTKITATVEQAGDGSWTASVIGKHIVLGTGDTKEAAIENLREGMAGVLVDGLQIFDGSEKLSTD
jgi:predicted RNase H-like HicB family nuclease